MSSKNENQKLMLLASRLSRTAHSIQKAANREKEKPDESLKDSIRRALNVAAELGRANGLLDAAVFVLEMAKERK